MTSRQVWTLICVCTATFMLLLDITIVNVALPDIAKDLHSSFSSLQWVIDAYSLSLAALMLTAGSVADILGSRRIFVGGVAIFTVASALCGLAKDPNVLDAARALQGVGGAAMFSTSLALLAANFQGKQRGTAFGLWGATIGGAVAVGPLVGGVLTESVSWQSIFFINLPIGLVAIIATLRNVEETPKRGGRIDVPGVITFSSGLFFVIFALVRGNAEGWGSSLIVSFLIIGAVLLIGFVVVELRQKQPMLELSLFRKPAFAGASIVGFVLSATQFSMFLYLTLYIQNALGFKPLQAGLRFLPITVLGFFVAPLSGRLSTRIPVRYLMAVGLALVGIGLLLMGGLDASSKWTALLIGFVVSGAGVGLINPALATTAVSVVPPEQAGTGAGINNTFRQVGIATGIAGLGAVFQSSLQSKFPGGPGGAALASGDPRVLGPGHAHQFLVGYTDALNELFLLTGVIALVGAALALILIRQSDLHIPGAPDVVAAHG